MAAPLGIATTRYEDRLTSAMLGGEAEVKFQSHQGVIEAGVLMLLPALLNQGLLKATDLYKLPANHYYGVRSIVMTLAFMFLARIKNPEQIKQCRPGEIGKIIGLDRIPEAKCLREKIRSLSEQHQAAHLNRVLVDYWYHPSDEAAGFLYIDGHVRIYYGHKANLPTKYVSRQKLCLSATTEYWVNDTQGMPVMMVMGELTEKLEQAITEQIIPELKKTVLLATTDHQVPTADDPTPRCTLVFDREAYHPAFFASLWEKHHIAVITYRKNVKDNWPEESFNEMKVNVGDQSITMHLSEQQTTLQGYALREIRRLGESGHQTSIITSNMVIATPVVAGRMFGRWSQENFFRYLMADYDFDKMIQFGTEVIDEDRQVVNPLHRKVKYRLKKHREKLQRLKAQLYPLVDQSMDVTVDTIPQITQKQIVLKEKIEAFQDIEQQIIIEQKAIAARIRLKDMGEQQRYNKLKHESKMLINILKMICYRAETAVANLLMEHLVNGRDEKRMVVKQIIQTAADLEPDYQNKTLTVTLHTLAAPRYNYAAGKLAELLTQTETLFPGTDLRLIFKTTA